MTKITEYYLNKASYLAVDEKGNKIAIEIDYWNGKFSVAPKSRKLENFARELIKKKHRVNFVHKMNQ